MQLGVNVPNFGPGTDPGVLREWARVVEGLGFELLMMSDHVVVTPEVSQRYPEPFYEPFTALSWLAGQTTRVRLGTTVLVLPYRHPALVARMVTNLDQLSGGRFVLGAGIGWSQQEYAALGVPFAQRGRLTDAHLTVLRETVSVPIWVGGNSDAAIRRAARFGDAWHPLRNTIGWLRAAVAEHAPAGFAPRIALRLTGEPADGADRLAGVGTIEQVLDDLEQLRLLGAETVVLDPYNGDPEETRRPEVAWQALTALAEHRRSTP
ncbi:LLM class flavin-dependent oxidoreductase [Hamadaea tsunoensis]|uniref:LLM class flavin-dependent oxidoreductase n=1 Tax=Hamadaea tsunoensis TaxID=53368 RepID=UPI0003FD408C|nr:LLM class flavin-dependent oxidoreductase [Hamadaea tsunoensis]